MGEMVAVSLLKESSKGLRAERPAKLWSNQDAMRFSCWLGFSTMARNSIVAAHARTLTKRPDSAGSILRSASIGLRKKPSTRLVRASTKKLRIVEVEVDHPDTRSKQNLATRDGHTPP